MKKLSDPNEKIELANLLAVFRLEMKKLREQLNKKGYICRYCGKQAPKPHGGKVHTTTNATNLLRHKKYPATNQPQGMNVKKLNNYFVFGVK